MHTFLWLLLLVCTLIEVSPASSQVVKNIFILAGQSNMAGRGGVTYWSWDGIVPPQCQPNPSVLRLTAGLTWVEASEPLHKDIDVNRICGIGPGMAFANAVLKNDSSLGVVGLIPCAAGGTNISQWARGDVLYNQLVRRARAALQGGGRIRAVLWYQGESDTKNQTEAKKYKKKVEKFFTDLRSDLRSPLLPIIQVAITSGDGFFIDTVREAQLELDMKNVRTVDARGLELSKVDNVHLTAAAQVQLGEMLANAFLQPWPSS